MDIKKHQHVVPQCYLKGFVDNGSIWQYPKDGSAPKAIGVTSAAVGKHFYSYRQSDGSRTMAIENTLCDIESAAAPVFRRLAGGEKLSELKANERNDLAVFMGVQLVRGFGTREFAESEAKKLRDPDVALRFLHSEDAAGRIPKHAVRAFEDEIKEKGVGPDIDATYYLPQVMARTGKYAAIIAEMKWKVERARNGHFFATSDNPVFVRRRGHDLDDSLVGLARKDLNIELTFPISKHVMLLAAWKHSGHSLRRSVVSPPRVRELNRKTVLSAYRYVFAHRECEFLKELIDEHHGFRIKY